MIATMLYQLVSYSCPNDVLIRNLDKLLIPSLTKTKKFHRDLHASGPMAILDDLVMLKISIRKFVPPQK